MVWQRFGYAFQHCTHANMRSGYFLPSAPAFLYNGHPQFELRIGFTLLYRFKWVVLR